jgi:outer membrane protein TolC
MVSRNEGLIDRANNTVGNAGMLPNINFNANGSIATKNTFQRTAGTSNYTSSVLSNPAHGANVALNWTLFDGGKMFITKDRLSEVAALGEIQFREQVMQTISNVISAYFNVVKQKKQLISIEQTITYNQERVKIAETGFNSGSKMKSDLLQAKIDLNVNLQNAINQEAAIVSARRELAVLLSAENDSLIAVIDSFTFNYSPNKEELQYRLYSKNNRVLAFQKQLEIEQLLLKESYRSQLPKLDLNAGYYYTRKGPLFSTLNDGITYDLGPQVGWSLSLPIFQSGDLRRQIAISKIGLESSGYNLEKVKLQVNTELKNALTSFYNQQQLLEIERENFALTKENLEISLQRMRLGEATSLEVRIAQEDFEQSATRLTNFQYNLKMAETKVKQLMGEL